MRRWASVVPFALVAATGCLATKSDIQLMQTEFRATRAQVAQGDSSIRRDEAASQAQVARLSATIDRMNDSLRILAARLASFQAATTGELDALGRQVLMVQQRLGETTKNLQDTRAQLEALREQGMSTPTTQPPSGGAPDTSHAAPSGPGPATLFTTALQQLKQGSFNVAKNGFDQLLATYPMYEQAPAAQLWVAEAYKNLGNIAAADSVYQLVARKYPNAEAEAATGLYRHAKLLWDAGRKNEARPILNKLVLDYPRSDEARQAQTLLRER